MKFIANNLFVALFIFTILCKINALTYQITVSEKPLISERFLTDSVGNGEIIKSREITNRVHHKHEQNVGDIHVLTNINIENIVTIRNVSNSNNPSAVANTTSQPIVTTKIPGK